MANNERYVTTIELNSEQAQDRLKKLINTVEDLKRKKNEALSKGQSFLEEAELKKATKELKQWRVQMQGVQGVLNNINDQSLETLQKTLRKMRVQSQKALPGSDAFNEAQEAIVKLESRISELKNSYKDAHNEAQKLNGDIANLNQVMMNMKGASLNQLTQAQAHLERELAADSQTSPTYQATLAQLKQVKSRIQEIKAEQQQIVHQIDKYDQEIKTASKDMAIVKRETALVDATLRNMSTANVRDLEYSIKILNERLREMPRGTAAFEQMQNKVKGLRTELERVRFEGAAQQTWLNRTADFFNKIQGAAIAAIGAITGLSLTIRRCVEAFAGMDQEMENVRKYTGQTSEQVHEMNEKFKELDTRTARERLNQLAGDAGRLGIQGQEAIMEFVDAADKINVALGDDLGENAVKNIGKLAMSFGTDKTMGLRGAMLATGSAVNELSQNSSAAANYLVDFTARVAGFGKQVGLTQSQIMGFAAVMDENMLQDEMAATAFGQLLVKMTTDIETFANITGMKTEAFKKMVTEDINGAVLAVAKSLQGRDMQEMGKIFDDMNLNGQRAIGVLATLGQKVGDVQERQRIANEAFEQGTSIIDEFNIQNTTVQANLEKEQKKFRDLAIVLGEKLMPIARYGITTGALLVKSISALISFVEKYAVTLTALSVTLAAVVALKEKDVIVSKLQVFWNEKLLVACKRLWAVLIANPWAAVATAVALVIGLMADFSRKSDAVAESTRKLNKIKEDARKRTLEEKDSIEMLIKASKNDKLSLEERLNAIGKLQKQIPNYITELDKETGRYKENKKALDDYLKSLAKKYELEGAKDMLADLGKEIANATVARDKAKSAADNAKKAGPGTTYTTSWGAVGNTTDDLVEKTRSNLDKANNVLQQKLRERDKIMETYGVLLQQEGAKATEQEETIVNNNPPKYTSHNSKKEEAERKKREAAAAKELRDRNNAIKAETEAELAMLMQKYSQGLIDYRSFVTKRDEIMMEGYNKRMAIYDSESDEYKKILNDREQYAMRAVENQERMSLRSVEREHLNTMAQIQSQQWNDEGAYQEALYQADIDYLQKKAELYRKGSEERVQIEEEIEDREFQHRLERQQRYDQMVEELRENILNLGNQRRMEIALNGLDELHKKGLIKEEEYQRAKIALQAQYANSMTPSEQATKTGSEMLTVASDKAKKEVGNNTNIPIVGTVMQYKATMDQLKELYASDENNHAAYLEAKRMATAKFCEDMASQFQAAYNSINQIMSAASSLYSAQQEYETAIVKKKYDEQIAAAGKNQRKIKRLQEKQAKEEAAIKSKYNARAVKIQIAQAIASTALSAINAYASAAQVPMVGYILAPIAAAAATAAGMIQVAAIKKQAEAQEAGYYEGGFTGGRQYRREAGVVHQGEFVANHQAVNNPNVRPMLEFLDKAQRNNTIGSLTPEDISRQLGNGDTIMAPVVNVTNDNEELREELSRSREVNERLLDVIENDGIGINFPMDTFDKNYKHFQILKNR